MTSYRTSEATPNADPVSSAKPVRETHALDSRLRGNDGDVWALLDDRPGHANQARGLAEALHPDARLIPLSYNVFSRLPNALLGASLLHLDAATKAALRAPWPAMVIACGRRSEPVARWIKKQNPATKIVYIMTPSSLAGWDALVIPSHDNPPANDPRIIRTLGALHGLTPETLAPYRDAATNPFLALETPRIAVLAGDVTRDQLDVMLAAAESLAGPGGSLLVTNSRRTKAGLLKPACDALSVPLGYYDAHANDGATNPYRLFLAIADAFIVSGDSLSMCSEAAAQGKPVFIAAPKGLPPKHQAMHRALYEAGHARPLAHATQGPWQPPAPPDETARVAAELSRL